MNIPERCLEVFRDPTELDYTTVFLRRVDEGVAPAAMPDALIAWGEALG